MNVSLKWLGTLVDIKGFQTRRHGRGSDMRRHSGRTLFTRHLALKA